MTARVIEQWECPDCGRPRASQDSVFFQCAEAGHGTPRLVRYVESRSPQAEDHETCGHGGACVRPKGHTGSHSVHLEGTPFSVPQDEDHEAGIEAAYDAADACFPSSAQGRWLRPAVEAAVAAYLSRVSPSRDGTVAVEDVRARVEAKLPHPETHLSNYGRGYVTAIREVLAEFSPASTGNREEKKA